MTAMQHLLAGLIDYAGLYPPAALDMRTALRNYSTYARSKHSAALGRFLVDANRLPELRAIAADSPTLPPLSLIASPTTNWDELAALLHEDSSIDSIEIKPAHSAEIEGIASRIPPGVATYFELPCGPDLSETLATIQSLGARVKLRLGGLTADAFPPIPMLARTLQTLADRSLPFKATAGLHHPVRSCHPFTYAPDSPSGFMHGFLNLACAAALLYGGGDLSQATLLLEEQDPTAWQVTPAAIAWRSYLWTTAELHALRESFLTCFGACSFTEPIEDLEALGWL
jgi:hypothetical protein